MNETRCHACHLLNPCPVHAQVKVRKNEACGKGNFSSVMVIELKEGDTATMNGPCVIVLPTMTQRGVKAIEYLVKSGKLDKI